MSELIDHPVVLVFAALLGLPFLFPIARFFFDDFEKFKAEAGLHYDHDKAFWLLGLPRTTFGFRFKIVGMAGAYSAVVVAIYQFLCRMVF